MSLALNYPTTKPSLTLDFANTAQVDPRITFSRASSATYYDSNGVLRRASANQPRVDYNPATLAAQGLLIEEQRTNLLTYSSDFDNAAWVKTDATVSANSILSPDGNINADTVTNDSTTAFHQIEQAVTGVLSTQYAISVYAKAGTHPRCRLAGRSSSNWVTLPNGIFDLTTGLVVTSTGDKTATIEAAGNGWYRCTIYGTCTTSTNIGAVAGPVPTGLTTNNFNGTTYPGNIYLWGAQLEAGAFPTSYIPSTNTFTSRASTGSFFDATGTLQSAAINVARNTYNPANLNASPFLLLEEARTNSIRNSTMVGAVAGTPGTLPTNWQAIGVGLGTLTQQIVGTGTSAGIAYIDIRLSGTTSTTALGYTFESLVQIAASVGQTWTNSFYIARVAGSNTNISSIQARVIDRDIGGVNIGSSVNDFLSSLTTSFTRPTVTRTLAGVGTAFVSPDIFISFSSGVAIDITLRIGLPQLEQGAFATSVIPNSPTFTSRASAATYYNSAGLLTSAATNVARYNYNPANLTQPANLILEAAATNLLLYSEEFDAVSDWMPTRTSVTVNAAVSPAGSVAADALVIDTTAATNHSIGQSETVTSGTTYTWSVFAKANQITQINLRFNAQFPAGNTFFDLSAGTLQNNGAVVASSITPVGNGWYRCTFTQTASATGTAFAQVFLAVANAITIATANGTDNVLLWGAQLETGAVATTYVPSTNTFTSRASTGTYFDSAGVLQSAAINIARNTYNPANLSAAPFLLLEEARTNNFVQSGDISNASWTKVRSSTPGTTTTSPSGGLAQKLVEDTSATSNHFVRQDIVVVSGTTYTQSVFVKAAERSQIALAFDVDNGAFAGASAIFDLTGNGSVTITGGTPPCSITLINNGWYRCTITQTAIANATAVFRMSLATGGTAFYTGNGTSGLFFWGAQLEAGAYPTSYIPTTTTALTRSADVSSSATTTRAADVYSQGALTRSADVSSSAQTTRAAEGGNMGTLAPWFNASEGTLFNEVMLYALPPASTFPAYSDINDGTTINRIALSSNQFGNNRVTARNTGGVLIDNNAGGTISVNVASRWAVAYASGNYAGSANGGSVVTSATAGLPTGLTQMTIGRASGSNQSNGWIRRITYYPKRLSNTELQAITS